MVLRLDAFQTLVSFQEVPLNTHKKGLFPMSHSDRLSVTGAFEFRFVPPFRVFFPLPSPTSPIDMPYMTEWPCYPKVIFVLSLN